MSITGQVGHVSFAKQSAFGTPNVSGPNYVPIKITGDSLVANNNMLVAEGEIGVGRDVSSAIPGGFQAAGAVNGNLRVRTASVLLQGALGTRTEVVASTGHAAYDQIIPANSLPVFTVEKKIGTSGSQLLVLQHTDTMINTLNISVPSAAFATFSAGLIACGQTEIAAALSSETYDPTTDQTLAFHGGRIQLGDFGTTLASPANTDTSFQSFEVAINNNVQADEYTIRPSRFLRSLTEGIRGVEVNASIIFDDKAKYEKFGFGAAGNLAPGYNLYNGALQLFLGNWQVADTDNETTLTPTGAPANPQAMGLLFPKLAFSSFPITLTTGRIVVQVSARALMDPSMTNIMTAQVRPYRAGFNY